MLKVRVCTCFSGYDSQCMSLDRLTEAYPNSFSYELVAWSEIDENAIRAHNAVYPQWSGRNLGDITKIDWDNIPDFDLLTYSSPCQDFSFAGLQRGGAEGSGTRSSLLWEVRKAVLAKRPKFLLMENVKALVSKKFFPLFRKWEDVLASYGYSNFWQVMNAKDYGIPQNRERVFLVSILNDSTPYIFPKPFELEKHLTDVLEPEVDENYFISDRVVESFIAHNARHEAKETGFLWKPKTGGNSDLHSGKLRIERDRQLGDSGKGQARAVMPLNTEKGGCALTIKSQYGRNSMANFFGGKTYGATAVVESNEKKPYCTFKGQTFHNGDGLYVETSSDFTRGDGRHLSNDKG